MSMNNESPQPPRQCCVYNRIDQLSAEGYVFSEGFWEDYDPEEECDICPGRWCNMDECSDFEPLIIS